MRTNKKITFLILIFVSIGFFGMDFVQKSEQKASSFALDNLYPNFSAEQPSRDISNISQIEEFFDNYILDQIEEGNLAGVTLSIVQGDNMTFAKGYGYRDIDAKSEVEANATLFRIGSISKLFTWTAIMQLYEQGKVDLNIDINNYLTTFQIPATFEEPITLAHLMTHTAGFEETAERLFSDADIFPELSEFLREILPKRQFKPGTVPAYSNYGAALAGLIVEEISEIPFEQYIEKNIFEKLNMTHSTFYQTLPTNLANSVSKSYLYSNSEFTEGNFTYLGMAPAGSMYSTADDIAKFMIAQMNNGSYQGNQILEPATIALMQSPHFQARSDFPSILYGFYERDFNGQLSFGHGGDLPYFHSQMSFFPDYDFGIFISYNTESSGLSPGLTLFEFVKDFMETRSNEIPIPMQGSQDRVTKFTGEYRTTRMWFSTFMKINSIGSEIKMTSNEKGQLILSVANEQYTFVEIEENLFAEITGKNLKLYFAEDEDGNIKYLYHNSLIIEAYEKLNWYEHMSFNLLINQLSLLIIQLSLIYWMIEGFVRLSKKKKSVIPENILQNRKDVISEKHPPVSVTPILKQESSAIITPANNDGREIPKKKVISNWPRWIVGCIFLLVSGTDIFMGGITLIAQMDPTFLYHKYLKLMLVLTIPILICVMVITVDIILEWMGKNYLRPKPQKLWERIHFTLVVLSGISTVWLLIYWGLL
ncbi:MAG: serine hydrolase domain-containing protein [Promethearchaeota archaeon]